MQYCSLEAYRSSAKLSVAKAAYEIVCAFADYPAEEPAGLSHQNCHLWSIRCPFQLPYHLYLCVKAIFLCEKNVCLG